MIPELFFVPESRVQSGSSHQATGIQDARTSCLPRNSFSFGGWGGGGGALRDNHKTAARETTEQVDKTT